MNEIWLASYVVLWIVVAMLSFVVVGLLRQLGLIQLRLGPDPGALITREGLERGTLAPDFTAPDALTGVSSRLADLRGHMVLLVFLTPTCISCRQLMPHLRDIARDRARDIAVFTICHGSEATCGEFAQAFRLDVPVLVDGPNAIAASYDVQMTPFAFLIDVDGVIRLRGVVNTWPQLESLIAEEGTVNPKEWPQHDPLQAPAPTSGPVVSLTSLLDQERDARQPAVRSEGAQRGGERWIR
jgi:methylamine dehydrogenase accessory protein MauD